MMFPEITPSPFKWLHVRQDGGVLRVELHAPATGNTLTAEILDEMLDILGEIADRADIRVLILSGAGNDFSLGADVKGYRELLAQDPSGRALSAVIDKGRRVCEALESTSAVTIARLHGRVTGAGLALAMACDLRAAGDTSRFRMPELAFSLVPAWGGGLGRLIAEAGDARIRELVLTCAEFDARQARDLSLVQKVEAISELDAAIDQIWVRPLLRRSPEAVALTKRLFTVHSRSSRGAESALLDADLLTAQLRQAVPPH
jgi:methylglutaconyl-CoA hydratase